MPKPDDTAWIKAALASEARILRADPDISQARLVELIEADIATMAPRKPAGARSLDGMAALIRASLRSGLRLLSRRP